MVKMMADNYQGITHGLPEKLQTKEFFERWKKVKCSQGQHLFDEVWAGGDNHYLFCDACEMEVHIAKVKDPNGTGEVFKNK